MAGAKLKARPAPVRRAPVLRKPPPTAAARETLARVLRAGLGVQPLLQVGAASDPAEREADSVADRVLSGPAIGMAPAVAPAAPGPARLEGPRVEPEIAPLRRSALDQPSTDALQEEPPVPAEQQDFELPKTEDVDTEALDDAALGEIEAGEPAEGGGAAAEEAALEEPAVASKRADRAEAGAPAPAIGPEGGAAPPGIAAAIRNPGPGRGLPRSVRADLEPRFGSDFSDVRLHDRPGDRKTAGAIGARAFAYGRDIWLGDGERAENRRLMAHELTHVIQQTGRDRSPHTAKAGAAARPQRMVRRFLGDAVLEKIEGYARHIPGYTLISYALGKTPVAQKKVERTPETLIYAVMGLHPLGTMLADRLKEARVIPEAAEWLSTQLATLNLTWARVQGVVARARELFSLLNPLESIRPAFAPLIRDIMRFVTRAKEKVVEFIFRGALKLAGPMAEKVWGVIKMAGNTIKTILDDPLQFAKNLFRAVTKGFGLFFTNILKHLKKGLLGFIFGALDGIDIQLPERLDLKGIVSIIFQVLRLTWANIRRVLVKKLGPNGERKVAILEKGVDIIRLLITEGVLGIWKKMLSMIDKLTSTVMTGIISFITGTIVKGALGWLAGLSNPVGAVVKICLMIYDFVVMLLERMQQILDFVQSVFSSIAAIAKGNIDSAAKAVEDSIGRTVPLILAFLAALIPVTGIASKIQSIMRKLRKPIDRAISKLVGFLVKKGKKLLSKVLGKLNAKRKLPETTLKVGKRTHRIYGKKVGRKVGLFIKSTETARDPMIKKLKKEYGIFAEQLPPADLEAVKAFITAFERETGEDEDAVDDIKPDQKTKSNEKETKEAQTELDDSKKTLEPLAARAATIAGVDTEDPGVLLRFKVAVSPLEGKAGTHASLSAEKEGQPHEGNRVVDADHNPPLAALDVFRGWLERQGPQGDTAAQIFFRPTTRGKTPEAATAKAVFGALSTEPTSRPGGAFPAMAIYGTYNSKLAKDDAEKTAEARSFIKEKTLADAPAVKRKLKVLLLGKILKVKQLYAQEPAPLKGQVEKGADAIKAIAKNTLKLEDDAQDVPEQAPGATGNLVRGLAIDGKQPGGTDFFKNEGAVGSYSSLSGKKTLKNYLEADHMPMDSEMKQTLSWRIADLLGAKEESRIRQHPAFRGVTDGAAPDAARLMAKRVIQQKITVGEGYKRNRAGAVVVAAEVNQDDTMKDPENLASVLRSQVTRGYSDAARGEVAKAVAEGRESDPAKVAAPARRALNSAIQTALRTHIVNRQARAFGLYATKETPRIRQINKGNEAKAAAALSRIAAKVKSSATTGKLMEKVAQVFPA